MALLVVAASMLAPQVAWPSARPPQCAGALDRCDVRDTTLDGIAGVEIEFVVHDSLEHLWAFVADCMRWPQFLRFLGDCIPIPQAHGRRFRSTMYIDGKRWDIECESFPDERTHVENHRMTGDFRAMRGRWRLVPLGPDRTLVTFTLPADIAWYVPASVVRRHLRGLAPQVIDGMQRLAAGNSDAGPSHK